MAGGSSWGRRDADSDATSAAVEAEWFRRVVVDDGRRRNEGGKFRLALALHQLLALLTSEQHSAGLRNTG